MLFEQAQATCERITTAVSSYFVTDNRLLLNKILAAFIGGGHILFEDNPGLGKTLLVKVFARVTDCNWNRIQFTPDLMPSDIVGTKIWKSNLSLFELEKGPIFTNFLLADEINRAMPKTQSALLEAMEERQVTIEGDTHHLSTPFTVMATQNPIEMEGTYPLPEAQMDRFMIRLSMGYVDSLDQEAEILRRRIVWRKDDPTDDIQAVTTETEINELQKAAEEVYVDESILNYISTIVRSTRNNKRIRIGASPRGSLALLKLSRALAVISGRNFVIPDDVKMIASDALLHRVIVDLEYALEGIEAASIINEIINSVEVPTNYRERP
jgi:MoxR-like ATPase